MNASKPPRRQQLSPDELQTAKAKARERYAKIAELLKLEAGVTRHYEHNQLSGLAWSSSGRVLAPAGVTRRQLYVLAHECAHILLHSNPAGQSKPTHVKELEAEVYAHRAFKRYGLEVPSKSSLWSRAYVALWIQKDQLAGLPICSNAIAFSKGRFSPDEPLASIDGQPPRDFSRSLERFIESGTRVALQQEAEMAASEPEHKVATLRPVQTVYVTAEEYRRNERNPDDLPIACGTCRYRGLRKLQSTLGDIVFCLAHQLQAWRKLASSPQVHLESHCGRPCRSHFWAFSLTCLAALCGFFSKPYDARLNLLTQRLCNRRDVPGRAVNIRYRPDSGHQSERPVGLPWANICRDEKRMIGRNVIFSRCDT